MAVNDPTIDIHLQADRLCYISRETRFSLVVFLTLSSGRPVTIIRHEKDNNVGLADCLISKWIECIDIESGESMPVLESPNQAEGPMLATSNLGSASLMTLENNRRDYMTFTTATEPRGYEFTFGASTLKPDRSYTLRCTPSSLAWWSHSSKGEILSHFHSHNKLPAPETRPLRCHSSAQTTITFSTRSSHPTLPKVTVSLSCAPTFSLSATPLFSFTTTLTLYGPHAITALAERPTVIRLNSDIEILSAKSGERVAPDTIDIYDDGPWEQKDFLQLEPGVPYVEQRSLDATQMDCALVLGGEYVLQMVPVKWLWWSNDSVDEVMRYVGNERSYSALGQVLAIELTCDDERRFSAVE
ncbi:MAG: hypothetical protein M1812_006559 [Candelaria pacifica]|nr:MAG: hypothetical protein M1812_006559 [Candelaria pacifica]